MKITIYIATSNKSKLTNFKNFFSWVDSEINIEQVPDYIEVTENGNDIKDNSKLKIIPYLGKYKFPVIANDSGLFFDEVITDIKDMAKVKRNALEGGDEKKLSQQEIASKMLNFYRQLAVKYGGSIDCQMKDVFTILLSNGDIFQEESNRDYQLVDRDVYNYDIFHPLNSLKISKLTGKFEDEMSEDENRIDKESLIIALSKLVKRIN